MEFVDGRGFHSHSSIAGSFLGLRSTEGSPGNSPDEVLVCPQVEKHSITGLWTISLSARDGEEQLGLWKTAVCLPLLGD